MDQLKASSDSLGNLEKRKIGYILENPITTEYYFVFETPLTAIFEIVNHQNAKRNFIQVLT